MHTPLEQCHFFLLLLLILHAAVYIHISLESTATAEATVTDFVVRIGTNIRIQNVQIISNNNCRNYVKIGFLMQSVEKKTNDNCNNNNIIIIECTVFLIQSVD